MAVLIPCLLKILSQVNDLNPRRDRSSDGWIGDPAHADSVSDHNPDETGNVPIRDADSVNEVHAIDIDETGPWPSDARGPWSVMRMVRQLVADCRAGRERRLRYIIYERTIWSASWGWTAREYTGANPHDKHCHLSASYDSAHERDTRPWNIGVEEDDMTEQTVIRGLYLAAVYAADPSKAPNDEAAKIGRQTRDALRTIIAGALPADLAARLDAILVAARDDTDVTVQLAPEHVAELQALRDQLSDEMRDAVADLGEGGAAAVRADQG